MEDFATSFSQNGFAVIDQVLPAEQVGLLRTLADQCLESSDESSRSVRHPLLLEPAFARVLESTRVQSALQALGFKSAFPVRSVLFDKSPQANWSVTWHQDLTICVQDRVETPGFGPWSTKAGIPNVQPPRSILDGMLTLRFHLDDTDETNGALVVVPGSHRLGVLSPASTSRFIDSSVHCVVPVRTGGLCVMRPLLLHSSKKATSDSRRRVLHIEIAANELPDGLLWRREGHCGSYEDVMHADA